MVELPERCASLHLAAVYIWQNGNVMVFDDRGQQMPDYQQSVTTGVITRIRNVFAGEMESWIWPGSVIFG